MLKWWESFNENEDVYGRRRFEFRLNHNLENGMILSPFSCQLIHLLFVFFSVGWRGNNAPHHPLPNDFNRFCSVGILRKTLNLVTYLTILTLGSPKKRFWPSPPKKDSTILPPKKIRTKYPPPQNSNESFRIGLHNWVTCHVKIWIRCWFHPPL